MFNFNENHGKSSLIDNYKHDDFEIVKIKNINHILKNIIKSNTLNKKIVIKIDTEGYDEFLISLINDDIINSISMICFEYTSKRYDKVDEIKLKNNIIKFNIIKSQINDNINIDEIINNNISKQTDIILKKFE